MDLIADILLAAAALGAMIYCLILSRRLAKLNDLDKGMGGAIAVLSVQVDDMTKTLAKAQSSAAQSRSDLIMLTERSEKAAQRLELILASMHDLPEAPQAPAQREAPPPTPENVEFAHRPTAKQPVEAAPAWRTRRSIKEAV